MKTIIIFTSCILLNFLQLSGQNNEVEIKALTILASQDYKGLHYTFSDYGDRNIDILFITNDTLQVTNHSTVPHRLGLLNFKAIYYIKKLSPYEFCIERKISCDRKLKKNKYTKPYSRQRPLVGDDVLDYIFPDLEKETIVFSNDFQKLQVKEFCFDKKEK